MAVDFARTLNAGEVKCKYLSQLTGRETLANSIQERVSFLWASPTLVLQEALPVSSL